jgi:microcystin-dependent protein
MGTPFMSEIKIVTWNFAPQGWAFCNGQFLPINQNQALFSLLGTTFGGNGQTNFALPNLQGKTPIHMGGGYSEGQTGGEQAHTLTMSELPTHVHMLNASSVQGNQVNPNFGGTGNVLAQDPGKAYSPNFTPGTANFNPASVGNVGGSQPHMNMQPYLTLNFCIALIGAFPSRN